MFRRFGEAVTILSLLFIAASVLFGGMYLGIRSTGALPDWAGDIFTAFSGGILALLGTMFASRMSRQFERRRLEHEQAVRYVQPYRDFMIQMYNLLSRKVYAQTTENKFLARQIEVTKEQVDTVLSHLPPLARNFLMQKREFQEQVEAIVMDGVILLQSEVDDQFLSEFDGWSEDAREIIRQLDQYENQTYA